MNVRAPMMIYVDDLSRCDACGSRCSKCDRIDPRTKQFAAHSCDGCGKRAVTFEGSDAMNEFCGWLFSKAHINFTCVAHNAGGYDAQFLYRYLIENGLTPQVLFKGCKLTYMHVGHPLNIRVLDSLKFLPMALAKLPKTFGLNEIAKGYFPHLFNTPENQGYIGPYPDPSFYGVDQMKSDDRSTFLEWHTSKLGQIFHFKQELHDYCFSDVDILRRACTKFRRILREITGDKEIDPQTQEIRNSIANGLDPFQFITIASVCMRVFRYAFFDEEWDVLLAEEAASAEAQGRDPVWAPAKLTNRGQFLVPNNAEWVPSDACRITEKRFLRSDIACVPKRGFGSRLKYSKVSMEWLAYFGHTHSVNVQHALNGERRRSTMMGVVITL